MPNRRIPARRRAALIATVVAVTWAVVVAFGAWWIVAPPRPRISESSRPVVGIAMKAVAGDVVLSRVVDPARAAGLRAGDRVERIDATPVDRPEDVVSIVSTKRAGDRVRIVARRGPDDALVAIDVEVEERAVSPADLGLGYTDVAISGSEGRIIRGWYVPAPTGDRPASPGVIYGHGNGTDRRHWLPIAAEVHEAGLAQLFIDFPGRGESDGRTITLGPREAEAFLASARWLAARPDVDASRIALAGRSMGAAAAAIAADGHASVAALVLDSPFAELASVVDEAIAGWYLPKPLFRGPILAAAAIVGRFEPLDVRPVDAVTRVAVPMLIVHGTRDRLVPIEHSRRIAAEATGPVELWEIAGMGHADPRPDDYGSRVADFLSSALSKLHPESVPP